MRPFKRSSVELASSSVLSLPVTHVPVSVSWACRDGAGPQWLWPLRGTPGHCPAAALGWGAGSAWLLLLRSQTGWLGGFSSAFSLAEPCAGNCCPVFLTWWQGMQIMASGSHVIARKQPQASSLEPHPVPAYLCYIS